MKRELLITASYMCHSPDLTPIIIGGEMPGEACASIKEACALRARLTVLFGPMAVLIQALLRLFGVADARLMDMEALGAVSEEVRRVSDNAQIWQRATARLIAQKRKANAAGRGFRLPDWFIWLERFDISIAPTRLQAIMAARSIKGRVVIMGWVTALGFVPGVSGMASSILRGARVRLPLGVTRQAAGLWLAQAVPD